MRRTTEGRNLLLAVCFMGGVVAPGCVLDWEEDDSPCGNEVIDPGEECDDGDSQGGDGCSSVCTVDHGWSCDNTPSVCQSTCGDGVIATGVEQCDQGMTVPVSGDGCSASCQIESPWTCSGEPSICTPGTW